MAIQDAQAVWGWTDAEMAESGRYGVGRVYGLCFRRNGEHARYVHAGHYVGIALDGDVDRRVWEHLTGKGSPLVAAAVAAGLEILVVLDVPGDRGLERRLHNRHGHSRKSGHGKRRGWCPLCALD
jgi:hypothetical protein